MTLSTEDLEKIRLIVREELASALKEQTPFIPSPASSNSELRNIALVMGLNIFPTDYEDLKEQYKAHGNLPVSMKESWQRFDEWGKSNEGRIAASISHRVFLDVLAERRRELKQEGKWPEAKKKKRPPVREE
ncbi:hypothetical protein KP005_19325 [Geomonas nitrogeniifigens]|uniref:Uncharacterized protein n=1 Tax=Geomonas diazotrophica TaxID=2843197 RepID=A0ABX8JGD7_9BACT|nr:hypothetical protein [Geomonas nitrogeniifigens]QWV97459.1 hypothetical protein KP005_19325 [Geomonas nitrogeniifigens]